MNNGEHLSSFSICIVDEHKGSHRVNQNKSTALLHMNRTTRVVFKNSVEYGNYSFILNVQYQMIQRFLPCSEITCPFFIQAKCFSYIGNNFLNIVPVIKLTYKGQRIKFIVSQIVSQPVLPLLHQ